MQSSGQTAKIEANKIISYLHVFKKKKMLVAVADLVHKMALGVSQDQPFLSKATQEGKRKGSWNI